MLTPELILVTMIVIGGIMFFAELLLGVETGFDLVLSGSALVVGGFIGLLFDSWPVGVVVAVALIVIYWLLVRNNLKKYLNKIGAPTNTEKLIGATGKVVRIVDENHIIVSVFGEEWRADNSQNLATGDKVEVVQQSGTVLEVKIKVI